MIENKAAILILLLLSASHTSTSTTTTNTYSSDFLISTLQTLTTILQTMTSLFTLLHQQCCPTIIYHQLHPMLTRSANHPSLRNGITLLTQSNNSTSTQNQIRCVGGTAGRSTLFQFPDHILGIANISTFTAAILTDMRAYVPRPHRSILETVEQQYISLPEVIERQYPDDGDVKVKLRDHLRICVDELRQWRSKRVAVVVRYVVQPASREVKGADGMGGMSGTGTGGEGRRGVCLCHF